MILITQCSRASILNSSTIRSLGLNLAESNFPASDADN